jgi:hypothetical protein
MDDNPKDPRNNSPDWYIYGHFLQNNIPVEVETMQISAKQNVHTIL